MLGNLKDFDPRTDQVPYASMNELDRWALQQLEAVRRRWTQAYDDHQYHVIYHGLHNFCSVTLSSFYLDIIKDRLYTFPPDHPERRAALTVLYQLVDALTRLMAPVLCFTAEEIWQQLETLREGESRPVSSVHAQLFPEALELEEDPQLLKRWERFIKLREEVSKALEIARQEKLIGTALEAHVTIDADDSETLEFLRSFGDELRFLLITSQVSFGPAGEKGFVSEAVPGLRVAVSRADGEKCERCWNYTTDVGTDEKWPGICSRCSDNVRQILGEANPA